uniref:DUF4806 domain-containing protein n=1 Tax=Strongyloides papillosus TaxID=174720 RepID=A0A0N5B382_STREA
MHSIRPIYPIISYRRSKSNSSGVSSELSSCFFTDDDTNFNQFNQEKLDPDSTTYSEFEDRINCKEHSSDGDSLTGIEITKKFYDIEQLPIINKRSKKIIQNSNRNSIYKNYKIDNYNESNIYENIISIKKPSLPPRGKRNLPKESSNMNNIVHSTKVYCNIDNEEVIGNNVNKNYLTKNINHNSRSTPDECYGSDSNSDFNDDETQFMNITNRIIENMEKDETPAPYLSDLRDKEPFIYSMMVMRILNNAREAHSKKVGKCQQQIENLLDIPHLFDLHCFNDDKTWNANTKIFGGQIVDHLGVIKRVSKKDYDEKTRKLYKILRDVKEKNFVRSAVGKITAQLRKLF